MLANTSVIFSMQLVQYNQCLISIEDTDDLVHKHQGISSHSADYAPMRYPMFKGYNGVILYIIH